MIVSIAIWHDIYRVLPFGNRTYPTCWGNTLREGGDCASDSGFPHAAHVMAGMSIVLDAAACGTLIDDRVNGRPDALAKVVDEIGAIRARRAA